MTNRGIGTVMASMAMAVLHFFQEPLVYTSYNNQESVYSWVLFLQYVPTHPRTAQIAYSLTTTCE